MTNPLISDIQLQKEFQPGDRILAKVNQLLTAQQIKNIDRGVKKMTREDVRVLVVNQLTTTIWVERDGAFEGYLTQQKTALGVITADALPQIAQVSCSKIDLLSNDRLCVLVYQGRGNNEEDLRRWAGQDVEVVCRVLP